MKKMFVLAIAISMLFTVNAVARDWTGGQAWTVLTADIGLTDNLTVHNQGVHFWVPSAAFEQYTYYLGLNYAYGDFWIGPHVGMVTNWFPEGDDGFLYALMCGFSYGNFAFLGEYDWYNNGDLSGNYSYFTGDYNVNDWFNVGAHYEGVGVAEDIDAINSWGPHVGFTKGIWHVEAQYYMDDAEGHTFRVLNLFAF